MVATSNFYIPVQAVVASENGILKPEQETKFKNAFIVTLSNKQTLMVPENSAILIKNNWIPIDGLTLGTTVDNTLLKFEDVEARNEELSWVLGFIEGNYDFHLKVKQINIMRAQKRANALVRCAEYLKKNGIEVYFTPYNDLSINKLEIAKALNINDTEMFYRVSTDIYNLSCFLSGYIDSCALNTKDKFYIEVPDLEKAGFILSLLRLIGINSAICRTKVDEYYLNVWSLSKQQEEYTPYINKVVEVSTILGSTLMREAIRSNKVSVISIIQSKVEHVLYQVPKSLINIFSIGGVKIKMI